MTVLQQLFAKFATRINREGILPSREFSGPIRDCGNDIDPMGQASISRTLFLRPVSTICSRSRFANEESELVDGNGAWVCRDEVLASTS